MQCGKCGAIRYRELQNKKYVKFFSNKSPEELSFTMGMNRGHIISMGEKSWNLNESIFLQWV